MNGLVPEDRALIEAGLRAHDPSDADRARVRALITAKLVGLAPTGSGAGGSGGAAPNAAAPHTPPMPSGAVGLGAGAKALLAGVLTVSAAVVGARSVGMIGAPRPERAAHLPAAVHIAKDAAIAQNERGDADSLAIPAPSVDALPSVDAPIAPRRAAPLASAPGKDDAPIEAAPTSPMTSAQAPTATTSVQEEARILALAQHALQAGQAAQALRYLDEHAQKFPTGVLTDERTAARVLALCALGRSGEARAIADRFIEARPHSPLTNRLKRGCSPPKD